MPPANEHLFQALLDASEAGDYTATYWLRLSDEDVGAAESRYSDTLQLPLRGQVLGATRRAAEPGPNGARLTLPAGGCDGRASAPDQRHS